MPVALNLGDAANLALQNVQIRFAAASDLSVLQQAWLNGIQGILSPPGDEVGPGPRTVLNLTPQGFWIATNIPAIPATTQTQVDANTIADHLFRICAAASQARLAGRITLAQGIAILALYNATWP